MKDYDYVVKMEVVKKYLTGRYSCRQLAEKYEITNPSIINLWVSIYQNQGAEAFLRKYNYTKHTFEEKLKAVKMCVDDGCSLRFVTRALNIASPGQLSGWVKAYRVGGEDALLPKKRGNKVKDPKEQINRPRKDVDTSPDHVRELEAENEYLRMENAILKEMRRLRLEEEAKKRGSQE